MQLSLLEPLDVDGHRDAGARQSFSISPSASACLKAWQDRPLETFEDWMGRALAGRGFKERSQVVYRAMWRKLVRHAGSQAACLHGEALSEFLRSVRSRGSEAISPTQQRRYLVLLSKVQEDLVRSGAWATPPINDFCAQSLRAPMAWKRPLPVVLSPLEEQRIQSATVTAAQAATHWRSLRDAALVSALLGSGIKAGEAIRLVWQDLRQTGASAWELSITTSGNKERKAPLSKAFHAPVLRWRDWLQEHKAPVAAPLFVSTDGECADRLNPSLELDWCTTDGFSSARPLSNAQVWRVVSAAMQDAGIRLRLPRQGPTVLRNTFALRQLRQGVSIEQLALWLGHKNPQSTRVFETLVERETVC
jgi:site-specific recombinase XerD